MRTTITLMVVLLAVSTGCNKEKNKSSRDSGLSEEQEEVFRNVNAGFAELDEAIDLAFASKAKAAPSDKVVAMASKLRGGDCVRESSPAFEDFSQEFHGFERVTGVVTCPINLNVKMDYLVKTGEWSETENFLITKDDFKDSMVVRSYELSGSLKVDKTDGQTKINGKMTMQNFYIEGIGYTTAALQTSQAYTKTNGGGRVIVYLDSRKQLKVNIIADWNVRKGTEYRINGHSVDAKVVSEFYGFLGIQRYIDRSLAMR
ncbi:MAG: hypothetical protein AB7F86_20375 [Bdellovibrionales bacterium]